MKLTPKNWQTFQHYKDRAPAWIKLHKGLLTDYKFACLPVASRALAPCLWLLASEYEDGAIDAEFEEIAFRLHMTKNELCEALNPLIEAGFFTFDSGPLAACKQDAIPEKEEEREIEEEREKKDSSLRSDWPSDFRDQFWKLYPKRVGKKAAISELERVRKRGDVPWAKLIAALTAYAATADPQFTKDPERWLKKGCYDDEPDTRKPNGQSAASPILRALDSTRDRLRTLGIRSGASADHARLLPQGGGERSRALFDGSGGASGAVRPGCDHGRDAPPERPAEPNGFHANAQGGEGGMRERSPAAEPNPQLIPSQTDADILRKA